MFRIHILLFLRWSYKAMAAYVHQKASYNPNAEMDVQMTVHYAELILYKSLH